jgi:hypothetical protein
MVANHNAIIDSISQTPRPLGAWAADYAQIMRRLIGHANTDPGYSGVFAPDHQQEHGLGDSLGTLDDIIAEAEEKAFGGRRGR